MSCLQIQAYIFITFLALTCNIQKTFSLSGKQLAGRKAVLKIRRGNRDNSGIHLLYFCIKIYCDDSLEPSQRDGSNKVSQHIFIEK